MPVLLRAAIDRRSGYVRVQFPFDRPTVDAIKEIPGSRWLANEKRWQMSQDAWDVFKDGFKYTEEWVGAERAPVPLYPHQTNRLRPYQIDGANLLTSRAGALLTMQMRTGKTPTAITALSGLLGSGQAQAALICYPASVMDEWKRQLWDWAQLRLEPLEGRDALDDAEIARLRAIPFLILGCHYEILDHKERSIHAALAGRAYAVIADEIHACKNRKAGRTKAMLRLAKAWGSSVVGNTEEESDEIKSGFCVARWGLTGTPMRNRNRDLYCLFDFAMPGSMGSYWTFAKRYCDAHQDTYGWVDAGDTNSEELQRRLAAISFRVTREQVASYLPKSDRSVIACEMPLPSMRKYRALEKAYAVQVSKGLNEQGGPAAEDGLRALAQATAGTKILTATERAYEHAARGVKVLVFATFHETLQNLDSNFDTYAQAEKDATGEILPPHFCVGGWKDPGKRQKLIEQWRACPGPSILLANTLSSGVGIDLADAEVAIFCEFAWVPADFRQAEDRIQDIHKGKRITPPIYEYLIVKETIDEAMAAKLLEKIRNIENIVGTDAEIAGVSSTLRGAGVLSGQNLGLENTSAEAVAAAIASIRDRWLLSDDDPSEDQTPQERLAAQASGILDDEVDPEMLDPDLGAP